VLHDDAQREFAYGPARGLPASRIGTSPQALDHEAKQKAWVVISMKGDWKRIFASEWNHRVSRTSRRRSTRGAAVILRRDW
jgi:hypothetical protein